MSETTANAWRVLLVDDDEDDYLITHTMLNQAPDRPVKLDWACGYQAGMQALEAKTYDAVLVDYDLGGSTGTQLIRAATQAGYPAPFILYTGRGNFEVEVEAMQAGATINITKQGATPQLLERSIHFAIERKQADQALRRSEQRWRQLAEAMPNLVWASDPAGASIFISRQWLEYTGRIEAEQLGNGWLEQIHPDDRQAVLETWQAAIARRATFDANYRIRRFDGVFRWFKGRAAAVFDENGQITQWFGSCTDIEELVQAETALQQRSVDLEQARREAETGRSRLEAVFDALPVGVAITDAKGGIVETNRAYEQIWSGPRPPVIDVNDYSGYRAWWSETGAELNPGEWASAQAVLNGKKVIGQLLKIQRFDGSLTSVLNSAAPIIAADGQIAGSAVAIQDISALRQVEQQLLVSEQKYRLLFNSMSEAVALLETIHADSGAVCDYRFLDINPAYEKLLGVQRSQRVGLTASEIFGDSPDGALFTQSFAAGQPIPIRLTASVTGKQLLGTIAPMGESRAAVILNDITEAAKAEAALRERETELQTIMDITPALISYIDRDFRYRRLNQNYTRWFNRPVEAMQGRTVLEVLGPAAWESVQPYMERALNGETISFNEKLLYASGARDVHVSYIPHRDETGAVHGFVVHVVDIEEQKALQDALREAIGRATWLARFPGENPNPVARVAGDGTVLYCNTAAAEMPGWELQIGRLLPERLLPTVRNALAQGKMAVSDLDVDDRAYVLTAMPFIEDGYVNVYGQDVTDRRRAEAALTDYAELLKRSNRALEEFAFIASHDMQEPLRKISAFGELLKKRYHHQLDSHGQEFIERMQDAARRMQVMIDSLLAYSRVDARARRFAPVDLNQAAREALMDLEVRLHAGRGRVELGDLPSIEADPLQMRQLLLNLIGNALKFTRPGEPPQVSVQSSLVDPGWVELSVSDHGIGIPADKKDEIFQLFSRLHGHTAYEGAGLGLAICQKIVERHGGSIGVESVPDEGTTFTIRLPCKQRFTST